MTITPTDILASIPGWEEGHCTPLAGGLTNAAYKVVNGEQVAVLKYDTARRAAPFVSRREEAGVQDSAARAGLAPDVLYASDRVLLTRFLDGEVWQRGSFSSTENLEQVASVLKSLHALPLTGRSFAAKAAAGRYAQTIRSADPEIVQRCLDTIENARLPQRLCCCHNDLVAENLISAPTLMLLDWEYAADNDPFFDLAAIVEHHELGEAQVATLLDAYFDGDGLRWRPALEVQQRLYLALLYLWMASRGDSVPDELAAVKTRVVTSCS